MRFGRSDWKKKWTRELDAALPELRADVRSYPISVPKENAERQTSRAIPYRRLLVGAAAVLLLCLCVLPLLLPLGEDAPPAVTPTRTLVTLHINPAAAFATDGEGKVTQIRAVNADADVILAHEGFLEQAIGLPLADAVVLFTDLAAQLGYLDLDTAGDAICLRVCEGASTHAEEAVGSLEQYFCQRGARIAVAEEEISGEDFSRLIGAEESAGNTENLFLSLAEGAALFCERTAEQVGNEELSSYYESTVLHHELKTVLQNSLLAHLGDFAEHAAALVRLTEKSTAVLLHEDNPGLFIKNYWHLAEQGGSEDYTPAFAACMAEMKAELDAYEVAYGRRIESIGDLLALSEESIRWSVEQLVLLLENFSGEIFMEHAEILLGRLELIGEDTEELKSLMTPPKTLEEFLSKSRLALELEFDALAESHREGYGQERPAINDEDYRDFLRGIEEKYGSLAAFWEEKNS